MQKCNLNVGWRCTRTKVHHFRCLGLNQPGWTAPVQHLNNNHNTNYNNNDNTIIIISSSSVILASTRVSAEGDGSEGQVKVV